MVFLGLCFMFIINSEVSGLLMGDRILNFVKTVFFVDKSNHLTSELILNKNVRKFMKEIKND